LAAAGLVMALVLAVVFAFAGLAAAEAAGPTFFSLFFSRKHRRIVLHYIKKIKTRVKNPYNTHHPTYVTVTFAPFY
jgi:hypothetical protein